jgi:hypothetical protein
MVPMRRESRMIAQSRFSEEDMIFAMWASKALRSLGYSGVNAAMRTDSGSRICSPPAGWTKASPVRDWLYRTNDGGRTWALVQNDLPLGYPVIGLLLTDANDAFAAQYQNATGGAPVGPAPELLKTSDGGRTWKVLA